MTIRQISELQDGGIVEERNYDSPTPPDISSVLRLVLTNCADYIKGEGITISQDSIELQKLTFTYPGVAGVIEVVFDDSEHTPERRPPHNIN